ncbi:DUF2007 domain-containing protein [Paraglaciecola sp.]|uniref:putative signal transducing protein n=1 Tax=Paraglaciecola sp. TaxID=1920173 RepID=UPI0032677EAA
MKKVYTHNDRFMVFQVKQLLDDKGIDCFIKNEFAIGAVGELSAVDAAPEVWIVDEEWLPKVEQFIRRFEDQPESSESWLCKTCNELNEPNFEVCWKCGTDIYDN